MVPCDDHYEHFVGAAKATKNDGQAYDLETRFLDERTGRVLDSTVVLAARQEQLQEMSGRGLWTEVTQQQCFDSTGKKPVGVRWVDTEKADGTTRLRDHVR